jgi:DNA polymerase-1
VRVGTVLTNHRWLTTPHDTLTRYNRLDCVATAKLVPKVKRALLQSGNAAFWKDSFWPMAQVTVDMQRLGVGELDKEERNAYRRRLRTDIGELESNILSGTGGDYTDKLFNSPKQLARLLYDEWQLKSPPATLKRPARSTDLSALAWVLDNLRQRDEAYRGRLHDLFHRSRLQTILERYLSIEGDPDGRVRPTIKLTGTETLRLAYSGGPGEAVQQWPGECRSLIRAAPGKVFVSRDYSQLEARILAVLSNDQPSLEAFRLGRDIHTLNAASLFGVDYFQEGDTARAPEALRNYAKTFLYGISYGGKAESIKMKVFCPCYRCREKAPEQVNLRRDEVKDAADRWARAHFRVMEWRKELVEGVYGHGRNRTWTSPFGFKRRMWEPYSDGERSLMNLPMQHCASQIVNRAMIRLHALGAPIVLQMHDEIVLEVPILKSDVAMEQLRAVMEMPVPELGRTVFPTKGGISDNWGGLK